MNRMDEIRARADEAQRTHDLLFNSRGEGGPYGRQNWLSAAAKSSQDIPWLLERLEAVRAFADGLIADGHGVSIYESAAEFGTILADILDGDA